MKCVSWILLLFIPLFYSSSTYAQLNKPTLDTVSVGWGWWYMRMGNQSIKPTSVDWYVYDPIKKEEVFRSKCDPNAYQECLEFCKGEYTGDTRDIREKLIIGNKSNYEYYVKARYTDGLQWSEWSDSIHVITPAEPNYVDPEYVIVVWGHSLVRFGDQCNFKSNTRLGDDEGNYDDNFCHALQTELRRLTNKNIRVINEGEAGTRQSEWMRDKSKKYENEYNDHSKYKMALFFFGANDAANNYPIENYKSDLQTICNYVTNFKVKTVVQSIHYTTNPDFVNPTTQINYRTAWTAKMNELLTNGSTQSNYLYKGFDMYQLFNSDPERFLGVDGIHMDLTEGMHEFIHRFGPFIRDIINNDKTNTNTTNKTRIESVYFSGDQNIRIIQEEFSSLATFYLYNNLGQEIFSSSIKNEIIQDIFIPMPIQKNLYFAKIVSTDKQSIQTFRLIQK